MERKMHFINRLMKKEDAEALLMNNRIAALAVNGDEGKPYVVPVHYIYDKGSLYFHSAKYGYKIDALAKDNRVCLTIVGENRVINEKFTAAFESVVIEGHAEFVEDPEERQYLAKEMISRWTNGFDEAGQAMIDRTIDRTAFIRICIDSMTGKEYRG